MKNKLFEYYIIIDIKSKTLSNKCQKKKIHTRHKKKTNKGQVKLIKEKPVIKLKRTVILAVGYNIYVNSNRETVDYIRKLYEQYIPLDK